MNPSPLIMVLTASAGAGHNIAARAIEQALRRRLPDAEIEYLDVLEKTNPVFRTLYAHGYLALINHAPTLMGLLYESMDRPGQAIREFLRTSFQSFNIRRLARYLRERKPDLIINTHFLPAELIAGMKSRDRLSCPQATITTDFETHRIWAQRPCERFYTATELGKAYLCTWGVNPETVQVTGIPVRATFESCPSKADARALHGFAPDRPVILMLSGAFGVGPAEEIFRQLLRVGGNAQIVAAVGRKKALQRRLERISAESHVPDVRVMGYTDRVHEFMSASDVLVSKPGGLTASEALVSGLPLVIINPIPGQETRNSDYLLEHGAAIKVNNVRILAYRIAELLADNGRLERMRHATVRIAPRGAADHIAGDALELIGIGPRFDKAPSGKNNPPGS